MIRRQPRSALDGSSAASDGYKRQGQVVGEAPESSSGTSADESADQNTTDGDSDSSSHSEVDSESAEGAADLPCLLGSIRVVDDGVGMDLERVRRGWLTVSLSEKQEMKAEGRTKGKERTPLGEQGLGRLGGWGVGYKPRLRPRAPAPPVSTSSRPSAPRAPR